MIRTPPERSTMENPIKIVRWSKDIKQENGVVSNMRCCKGTMEEVREYAEKVAKENDCKIEVII